MNVNIMKKALLGGLLTLGLSTSGVPQEVGKLGFS
jgi:hypothetical protein